MRDRKIPYNDLLLISLNKQGKTTSFEIRDYEIKKKGNDKVEYSDEAYLKQRRHLNPEVFKEANKIYIKDFYDNDTVEKIKGYIPLAIDGSTFEVPNTKKNREYFGYHKNVEDQKVKNARAQLSTIYDLNNQFYLDISVNKYKYSEVEMAKENIEKASKIISKEKMLIIFDRGYPSLIFMNWLAKNNIKFLMRLPNRVYGMEIDMMQSKDEYVSIIHTKWRKKSVKRDCPKEYEKFVEQKETRVRITKVEISSGETEILISNLELEEFNSDELKMLYNKRWGIESSYNTTKNKLKIESFTGNLPQFIYQDIYAGALVYNQIQDMTYIANCKIDESKKGLKHTYIINENKAIGLYKEQLVKIFLIEDKSKRTEELEKLINDMTIYVEAKRKGRPSQPRLSSLRSKYRTNLKPSF